MAGQHSEDAVWVVTTDRRLPKLCLTGNGRTGICRMPDTKDQKIKGVSKCVIDGWIQ